MSGEIERVAVLGVGSMGHGIAEVAAIAGYDVTMRDLEEGIIENAVDEIEWSLGKLAEKELVDASPEEILDRISTTTDIETAVGGADLVIEVVPETMDIKKDVYGEVDQYAPETAILATNTSSLSVTEIAAATGRPEMVVGMHFFNPPVQMDLVEVIYGDQTNDETAEAAAEFVNSLDKTPIFVRKDVNGFVVNNVLLPFMEEPGWMIAEDEATVRQADAAMVHERGYPMGPFELADFTGIDIGYHVREQAGIEVPPIIKEKVELGDVGKKAGKGYYDYEGSDGANYTPNDAEGFDTLRVESRMINEAAELIGNDVATAEEIDTGMRLGAGLSEGTCRTADKLGLDRVLEKLEALYEETGEERYQPAEYLSELVDRGRTGEEAGAGFFEYGGKQRTYHTITHSLTDTGVLEIVLDRPSRLNAMNEDMFEEIDHLLRSVDIDAVRCVVFEGTGDRAFSAGADIGRFVTADATDMMDITPVFNTVHQFDRPTVAKIEGFCLGAGLELALACDLRIATEGSEFGTPEVNLGLIPGGGGTQRLTRLIGETRTKELVFSGEHIDADRAYEWGILNRVVEPKELEETVTEFVDTIAQGPPIGLKVAKSVINKGQETNLDAALSLESQGFGLLMSTEDVREGVTAFQEDRNPEFSGE